LFKQDENINLYGPTVLPTKLRLSSVKAPITTSVDRWNLIKDNNGYSRLCKLYTFPKIEQRTKFIYLIAQQELLIQHFIELLSTYNEENKTFDVKVLIWTRGINSVTEIDKEFAAYCDIILKEILYA
jgi:pterin-4a-carbinolamine dehydratase